MIDLPSAELPRERDPAYITGYAAGLRGDASSLPGQGLRYRTGWSTGRYERLRLAAIAASGARP
jgi:hypothetical protein